MTVTTIYRIFFPLYEYQEMLKFEAENLLYKKIAEDTSGTTYEYRTYSAVDFADVMKIVEKERAKGYKDGHDIIYEPDEPEDWQT